MKISLDWINDFINVSDLDPKYIEEKLTSLGLECNIEKNRYYFDSNVVIGKILKVEKHPNADKLNICTVDVGEEDNLSIVCGAPNIITDIFVPVAKIGASIGKEKLKISKSKIRDMYSYGMICSGKELSLNEDDNGIMILKSNIKLGSSLISYVKQNIILDIDLTPNRGDCFSHLGVSREISTFTDKPLSLVSKDIIKDIFKTSDNIDIKVSEPDICLRYSAILLKNIKVTPSCTWLKDRLESIGCNSINNVVDTANYIMYDLGQPLHVFDYDKIEGKKIFVRNAKVNEQLETINGNLVKLEVNDVIIADSKKPLAIAGVIGGSNSHVTEGTINILIESAVFNELNIRKTSKTHDISTESSKRFERGVDVNSSLLAMEKFVQILQGSNDCNVSEDYIDIYPEVVKKDSIKFNLDACNKYLGTDLTIEISKKIFHKLNFIFKIKDNEFICEVPSYRNDLLNEVDLYEEIARLYGYDKIPTKNSFNVPYSSLIKDSLINESTIRNSLSNSGFNEHYSNSLYSKKDVNIITNKKALELKNPLSKELCFLRNSMLPGLLRALSYNINRKIDYVKMYEVGSCQYLDDSKYNLSKEERYLNIVWTGTKSKHWIYPNFLDIYSIKGDVDLLLENIGFENVSFSYEDNVVIVLVDSKEIGRIVSVDKKVLKLYDIVQEVFSFEINLNNLYEKNKKKIAFYNKFGQYPSIVRDISFIVDDKYNHSDLETIIYSKGGKYLKKVVLFDYYINDKFDDNQKSLAYSLEFKSNNRTLKDSEINICFENITRALKNKYKIILR